jgi:hypothetical protein
MLDTPYGGSIPLDWKQVKTLESDQELLVKQDTYSAEKAKTLKPAEAGKVTLQNGEAPKTVELASIHQIMKPKPLVEDLTIKGNIDAALDFQRADTSTDDYNLAFKTTARSGGWRHIGNGEYNREATDGLVSSNNWNAEYALDRFITEQWFWQGRLSYKRDYVQDLSRQRTLGTGPGYQFWDNELGAFSLGSLLNHSDYEFADGEKTSFYSMAVKWSYNRFLIGKTVEVFSNGELGKALGGAAAYALDSELGLRYKVTEWASLNLKYEKDLITGTRHSDLNTSRYTAGFGVAF